MKTCLQAALFDWDGVVVDSSLHHERSWEKLAGETGLVLPEGHFKRGFGMRNEQIIPDLLQWSDDPERIVALSRRKEEWFRASVREEGIQALPGIADWLNELKDRDLPVAVGSSTTRDNIACCLEILGFAHLFDDIVAAEDVQQGKPHPEVFLVAAKRLGAEAAGCVVFEDAPVGIAAGKAGRMKVVGLTTTHPAAHLEEADLIVSDPSELRWDRVAALFD